ncbi:DNA-binding transcriptional LysR family regulator [Fluviicoccus keumensis]|uniref:DNA-binding transcriptional LysR family regulator n=1 Tax=Fluviicoccus keumensis TaxID=1435465 RepID=A0A4Q7Z8A7_9GAMM|nr:LysR family transcriptional regulator [Fluviicoccus keumensis]RZU46710.1 DNA-binding transcriptional LysR family regulator [Fluviicoccus keumensis]
MRITLKQLGVFTAVARYGTVTRAAQELNLTQSAASMALADFETQLGCLLFDRAGKRLQLNDLGRQLLPKAITTLAHAEGIEELARGRGSQVGSLKIGASLTIGNYSMPPLIATFMREHPESQLTLEIANTSNIITSLGQFELDIGFIEGYCHAPDLEVIPWRHDELVVFAAPTHPLACRESLTETDLADAEWVLREPGSGTREIFDNAVLGRMPHVKVLLELGHTEAIQRVVASGLGVGCASRLSLRESLDNGSLKILPTPFWNLDRQFFVLIHRQKYRTFGLVRFLEHCFVNC